MPRENSDRATVDSFGDEWSHFDQSELSSDELQKLFDAYFGIFPWNKLSHASEGFDMGCGSGRWARFVAPKVGLLHCIDPSIAALLVAKNALSQHKNIDFIHASVGQVPLPNASQDFGYSLGVLHHIPDPEAGLQRCALLLKPGAPFLVYLYYALENRPWWFRTAWRLSDSLRRRICNLSPRRKIFFTNFIAASVYFPLARISMAVERLGLSSALIPLSYYRSCSFYTMRTDSRDRFGTPLERRFTRDEIAQMMVTAGFENIMFSDIEPFWVAVGFKR